jgi:hypothetical protein
MNKIQFVTAQPDKPYFHWQIKLYVYNFIKSGIKLDQINVIFAIVEGNKTPSEQALKLREMGINVHFYMDERNDKSYIPSIKPYLISKWLKDFPEKGDVIFLHDSDIVFTKNFDITNLIDDDINYLSDTIGYIGYNYIMECGRRYEIENQNSEKDGLIKEMANIIGINVDLIKNNQENSGGGQYLIKKSNSELWDKIYNDCTPLYKQMLDYDRRHPLKTGQIQFWTAEMWSILWNLWLSNFKTKISKDIDFCWATDNLEKVKHYPILHMAGVTDNLKRTMFYKGEYINVDPIVKLEQSPNHFDYINENNATLFYINLMKDFISSQC